MSLLKASKKDIERFMKKVDKLPNGCWFYMGARSKGGKREGSKPYGSFYVNGKTVRAHRFSSEVFNKDECPDGFHRAHTCCFSMCVNPEHVKVVPAEENLAERCKTRQRRIK